MPVLVRLTVISPLLATLFLIMVVLLIFSNFDEETRLLNPVFEAGRGLLRFAGVMP